jgi:hypothetical protein
MVKLLIFLFKLKIVFNFPVQESGLKQVNNLTNKQLSNKKAFPVSWKGIFITRAFVYL